MDPRLDKLTRKQMLEKYGPPIPPMDRPTRMELQRAFNMMDANGQSVARDGDKKPDARVRLTLPGSRWDGKTVRAGEFARLFAGAGVAHRTREEPLIVKANVQRGAPVVGTGKPHTAK